MQQQPAATGSQQPNQGTEAFPPLRAPVQAPQQLQAAQFPPLQQQSGQRAQAHKPQQTAAPKTSQVQPTGPSKAHAQQPQQKQQQKKGGAQPQQQFTVTAPSRRPAQGLCALLPVPVLELRDVP